MKRIALFLMVAGMLSMVACKSAPKQEETTEPATEQVDTTQVEEVETVTPDTTKVVVTE